MTVFAPIFPRRVIRTEWMWAHFIRPWVLFRRIISVIFKLIHRHYVSLDCLLISKSGVILNQVPTINILCIELLTLHMIH